MSCRRSHPCNDASIQGVMAPGRNAARIPPPIAASAATSDEVVWYPVPETKTSPRDASAWRSRTGWDYQGSRYTGPAASANSDQLGLPMARRWSGGAVPEAVARPPTGQADGLAATCASAPGAKVLPANDPRNPTP